jgi:hypothetical protein
MVKNMSTLVIILAETRAHKTTFENIKKNLINELNADLCVCIGTNEDYDYENPFYKLAKYRFCYKEPEDFGEAFDYASKIICEKPDVSWRDIHNIPKIDDTEHQFMGGVKYPNRQHDGSAGILIFFRWFLLHNLREHNLLDKYDYFIITRSDYIYKIPHMSSCMFNPSYILTLDCEKYGGITDRHTVVPKKYIETYLNIFELFVLHTEKYKNILINEKNLINLERLISIHLITHGLGPIIKNIPCVMYTIREKDGNTKWSKGYWSEALEYYIKYPQEFKSAFGYASYLKMTGMTKDEFYIQMHTIIN